MWLENTREVALYLYIIYISQNYNYIAQGTRRFAPTRGAPLSRNTADASTYTVAFLDISIATKRARTHDVAPVCRLMLVLVRVVRHPPDEVEPRRVIRVAKGEVGGDEPTDGRTDAGKRWGWMKSGTDRSSRSLPEKCAPPRYNVSDVNLLSVD